MPRQPPCLRYRSIEPEFKQLHRNPKARRIQQIRANSWTLADQSRVSKATVRGRLRIGTRDKLERMPAREIEEARWQISIAFLRRSTKDALGSSGRDYRREGAV